MKKNYFIYILILLSVTFSCIPSKKVRYLQTDQLNGQLRTYTLANQEYKLQKGDNIYIDLSSIDTETELVVSTKSNLASIGAGAKYKDVYLIDPNGEITIPQLGKIFVENYTIAQVHDSLYSRLDELFNEINLQVRLADGFITILGEVNIPGRYQIDYKDKMNVFEVLGLAGDLSMHANRKEVKIIRKVNDENQILFIDLTNENILSDPNFYLQANDIIYVEPLKAVFWDSKSFPFLSTVSIALSTITALLVIITYAKK